MLLVFVLFARPRGALTGSAICRGRICGRQGGQSPRAKYQPLLTSPQRMIAM